MERYDNVFAELKSRQEGAFVPFVTLGDPGPEQSLKIIDTLIEAGADALELGIPLSFLSVREVLKRLCSEGVITLNADKSYSLHEEAAKVLDARS